MRLENDKQSKKQKRLNETENERQLRLKKDRQSKKQARKVSKPPHEINKQDYLKMFDDTKYGGIEKQCWAKANMNKFHKSSNLSNMSNTVNLIRVVNLLHDPTNCYRP